MQGAREKLTLLTLEMSLVGRSRARKRSEVKVKERSDAWRRSEFIVTPRDGFIAPPTTAR